MFGWFRVVVVLTLLLTIAYAILWFRAQWRERSRAKSDYLNYDGDLSERDFVTREVEQYNHSFKPKLLLSVYGIPLVIMMILVYFANN